MEDIVNFGEYIFGEDSPKKEKVEDKAEVQESITESPYESDEIVEDKAEAQESITESRYESEEIVEDVIKEDITDQNEETDQYILYKDKSDFFSCDIEVEGADTNETFARIVVESEDWTLMFEGDIINGKVEIPMRKLNILNEGQVGTIRLEVVAEGTHFVPWEDEFLVKMSKKVTVSVNENKRRKRRPAINEKKVNIKVNK